MSSGEIGVSIPIPKGVQNLVENAYPSPRLSDRLFSRGIVPIDMGLTAVGVATLAEVIGMMSGNPPLPPDTFFSTFSQAQPLLYGLIGLRTALSVSKDVADGLERKNRINWPILSVTKHKMEKNFVWRNFPEQSAGEKFYGELHFSNWGGGEKFPSRRKALMHGCKEFLGLIKACEKNDPRLDGVNIFAGHSPIIHPAHTGKVLQHIGFEIKEDDKPDYRGWDAWINGEYAFRKKREVEEAFIMPKNPWWVGVVKRDVLIQQKERLEGLRNKLQREVS